MHHGWHWHWHGEAPINRPLLRKTVVGEEGTEKEKEEGVVLVLKDEDNHKSVDNDER